MRLPTWIALGVVGIQAMLALVGMARGDAELGMLAGLMTPLTLGAIAYALVSRRDRRH